MSSLRPEYIEAIEARLRWLKWVESDAGWHQARRLNAQHIFPKYARVLSESDTFCMVPQFADLVDVARRDVPDGIQFEAEWLQSKAGFLWVTVPFEVPPIDPESLPADFSDAERQAVMTKRLAVRAIAWQEVPVGERLWDNFTSRYDGDPAAPKTFQVLCFQESATGPNGFVPWSYFVLRDGDRLGDRIRHFESKQVEGRYLTPSGKYDVGGPTGFLAKQMVARVTDPLHEIRWCFAALHVMAQRLAMERREPVDRATRRRAEREGQVAPSVVRVITLRRLEQDRKADPKGNDIDWQWRWVVRGFWREQFYPSEGVHKTIWIDSYIKGPADKPLKPPGHKLFAAAR